jgi:hypothetical protein
MCGPFPLDVVAALVSPPVADELELLLPQAEMRRSALADTAMAAVRDRRFLEVMSDTCRSLSRVAHAAEADGVW